MYKVYSHSLLTMVEECKTQGHRFNVRGKRFKRDLKGNLFRPCEYGRGGERMSVCDVRSAFSHRKLLIGSISPDETPI